jgi:hypothetical protein
MLLGAANYLGMAAVLYGFSYSDSELVPLIIGGWHALLLLVTVAVIVDSVRKLRARRSDDLVRDLFVVKLASIPYFLINVIVLVSITFLGATLTALIAAMAASDPTVNKPGTQVIAWGLGAVAIAFGLTYFAMLTTSTYGWAAIAGLRRDRRLNAWLAALYRLMLLLFVTDVVVGILLRAHTRKQVAS